ncbi:MAG: metallophosphatase family protein [Bacteroidaceae bacterium]|nr:metallophosphatase family protein [Bacteroidaceae bacterium]
MNRREFLQRSGALAGAAYFGSPALAETIATLGDPNLVIGIVSDIHLRGADTAATFIHTLEYFRSLKVDGVIIAGDMADQGLLPQLQVVANAWFQVFPNNKGLDGKETVQLFIYGNHDMEAYTWGGTISSVGAETAQAQGIGRQAAAAWKQCFKEDYQPIWMKTIKGYHFIGAHWENQSHISGLADFLQEHNSELTADGKPFFYIQHPHPKDTCNCAWAWGRDDGTVTKLLSNYPNAIAFSGHSHSPLDDDRDLWQGAFTSIGTSSLKYLYPMPARENTYQDDWSAKPPSQMAKMDPQDGRQGMVMRVYDDAITFEKREFVYDEPIGEAWYLPWPISVTQPLSFENRAKTAAIPQFPAGTKATVTAGTGTDRYGTSQKQVTVHFPTVLKKNAGVRAFDYEVQVEYDWLDVRHVTSTKRVFSPKCYLGENKEEGEVVCVFGESELPALFAYRFAIRPCNCFGGKGNPIYTDWIDGEIVSYTSSLSLDKQFYKVNETIQVTFADAPVGTQAWVGIYAKGKTPGSGDLSTTYKYTEVAAGTLSLSLSEAGEYYAVMFQDSGYSECSPRIPFFVTSRAFNPENFSIKTGKHVYSVGDAIVVTLANAPAITNDWVGIYQAGLVPREVKSPTWLYNTKVNGTLRLNVSGTKNWTAPLPEGIYFVSYFMTDDYTEPFDRYYFAIGTPARLRSDKTEYQPGDEIVMRYSGLHPALGAKFCIKQDDAWQEVMPLETEEGNITLTGLAAGEHEYCICIEGEPISKSLTLTVTSDDDALNEIKENSQQNIIYRLNGTRTASMNEPGLYIRNGKKVFRS